MIALERNKTLKAFTLIELLVVVAILAVAIALAAPIFGKMREASSNTRNVANLRQLGTAMLAYAAEHDGAIPQTLQNVRVGGKSAKGVFQTSGIDLYVDGTVRRLFSSDSWPNFGTGVTDYLSSADVFYGPFTPTLNKNRSKGQFWEMSAGRYRIGYAFYYVPLTDDSALNPSLGATRTAPNDPDKRPITNSLLQTAHPRAPLFCDIVSKTWADDVGYPWETRQVTHVFRVDGGVHSIRSEIIRTSTENRIYVLAGYSKYE